VCLVYHSTLPPSSSPFARPHHVQPLTYLVNTRAFSNGVVPDKHVTIVANTYSSYNSAQLYLLGREVFPFSPYLCLPSPWPSLPSFPSVSPFFSPFLLDFISCSSSSPISHWTRSAPAQRRTRGWQACQGKLSAMQWRLVSLWLLLPGRTPRPAMADRKASKSAAVWSSLLAWLSLLERAHAKARHGRSKGKQECRCVV